MLASIATAIAMPMPMDLIVISSASTNAEKTQTMISAAPVITRAVRTTPSTTDAVLSPVRRQASWMRERSSTS